MKININKKSLLKSLGMTISIFSVAIFTAWAWHGENKGGTKEHD